MFLQEIAIADMTIPEQRGLHEHHHVSYHEKPGRTCHTCHTSIPGWFLRRSETRVYAGSRTLQHGSTSAGLRTGRMSQEYFTWVVKQGRKLRHEIAKLVTPTSRKEATRFMNAAKQDDCCSSAQSHMEHATQGLGLRAVEIAS